MILYTKLTLISNHFRGAILKLPLFNGLCGSWVLWKEQTFSSMSAVGLDQLCALDQTSMMEEDKRIDDTLVHNDYWVGSALKGALVKSCILSITLPKEGLVLASKIWAKLVGFFGCDWHACDCEYLVSIGQASEKQAAHNLANSFSGISFMGITIIDSIDDIHKFVRNKILGRNSYLDPNLSQNQKNGRLSH